jgi:hypothetical protein
MATLITGGTGLIGADVAKLLVERGEERPALFDLRPSDRRLEELGPGFDLNHGRHLALDKDAPGVRLIARPEVGTVVPIPEVGGLHYRNVQRAASSASPRGPTATPASRSLRSLLPIAIHPTPGTTSFRARWSEHCPCWWTNPACRVRRNSTESRRASLTRFWQKDSFVLS